MESSLRVGVIARAPAQVRQVVHAQTRGDSRSRARLAAKKRPSDRPAASFRNCACEFSGVLPSRSKPRGQLTEDHGFARGTTARSYDSNAANTAMTPTTMTAAETHRPVNRRQGNCIVLTSRHS